MNILEDSIKLIRVMTDYFIGEYEKTAPKSEKCMQSSPAFQIYCET